MSQYRVLILAAALAMPLISARHAFADEGTTATAAEGGDPLAKEEAAADDVKDKPEWRTTTQSKYNLTDAQMKAMTDKGIKGPGLAITAGLAEKSGKSVEEVAAMRTDQKMGWGKIAKELGVPPSEIGQSVANMRHDIRDTRHEARTEKQAKHQEKIEKREANHQERAERREARRADRAEKRGKKQ
jgi:hypothetical protein